MKTITPFANDSQSMNLGDFTIENGTDQISLYGSLNLTRDKAGLKQARVLKAAMDAIVAALEAERDLPDKIAPPKEPQQVKNPFA
jgi:hypothetical protein